MTTIFKNTLIQYSESDSETKKVERVLSVSSDELDIITIDIHDKHALPLEQQVEDIEMAISQKEAIILDTDPYAHCHRNDVNLSQTEREYRDKWWAIIKPLVLNEDNTPNLDIFIAKKRGPLIAAMVKNYSRGNKAPLLSELLDKQSVTLEKREYTKTTIYNRLRQYWQRGQIPNALLPDFFEKGGKGKKRTSGKAKRGAPNKYIHPHDGVNIDEATLAKLRRGWKRFIDSPGCKKSLQEAYIDTLGCYFLIRREVQDGKLVPILPPAEQLPTFRQFYYWYKKEQNLEKSLKARLGEHAYSSNHRPLVGDTTKLAYGSGSEFQIDSTPGNHYLVSALDRSHVIGRPTLYFVIDRFSKAIVGMAVLIDAPSWVAAMIALENTLSDKVAFCAAHGIKIIEAEWPCHHMSDALIGDKAEMISKNSDILVPNFNLDTNNTPSYEPTHKGIVEKVNHLVDLEVKNKIPGAVDPDKKPGDPDPRHEARLTLEAYRQCVIHAVLTYNKTTQIDEARMQKLMIEDKVNPYPLDIWTWGIQIIHPRVFDQKMIRKLLLPTDTASITHEGIQFRRLSYTCERARTEGWFIRKENGRPKGPKGAVEGPKNNIIRVVYDPRSTNNIFVVLEGGEYVECQLLDKFSTFRDQSWYDVDDYFEQVREAKANSRTPRLHARVSLSANIRQITSDEDKRTKEEIKDQSNSSRIKDIQQHRKSERSHEHSKDAWTKTSQEASQISRPAPNASEEHTETFEPKKSSTEKTLEMLRQIRSERIKNDE
jgi:hypothetical protein